MNNIGAINTAMIHQLEGVEKSEKALSPKELELKRTCQEFEAVLTASILKEGLRSAQELSKGDGSDSSSSANAYKDMANETMANFVGREGMLGLGDQLFRAIQQKAKAVNHEL
jgi:Rod binding domain-containing protein